MIYVDVGFVRIGFEEEILAPELEEGEARPARSPFMSPRLRQQERRYTTGRSGRHRQTVSRHVTVIEVVPEKNHIAKKGERLDGRKPLRQARLVVAEKLVRAGRSAEHVADRE